MRPSPIQSKVSFELLRCIDLLNRAERVRLPSQFSCQPTGWNQAAGKVNQLLISLIWQTGEKPQVRHSTCVALKLVLLFFSHANIMKTDERSIA